MPERRKNNMKHTTHKLSLEQKESLFAKYQPLLYMIHSCGGYILRRQMRRLFHLLTGRNEKEIEFDIAELILNSFLLQKTINKDTRTQMLYLSKYPKSKFLNTERTGDVPAINWSNQKIFEQIFKIDYLIEVIIPDMRKQNFNIDMDNIITYLHWNGSNLLMSANQMDMFTIYNNIATVFQSIGYILTEEFTRDMEISKYDMECFESKQLQKNKELPPCIAKIRRDTEMDSYNSEIERNKQFYTLKNLAAHGFYIERIQGNNIHLCYFDNMNSIQTKKLYQNLCYILLMFQRYLNNRDIELITTVYTWDKDRVEHLQKEERKQAYDFYRQEWVEENKKFKIMKDIGLLRQYWENIHVTYKSEDIYSKYNVHL